MSAGSSGGLRVPTRCDRSTLGSARLAGTDAQAPRVRRARHDVGATCLMCRRPLPVLADAASTGPTSPLSPPDVGFTPARATVEVLTGSTVRFLRRITTRL